MMEEIRTLDLGWFLGFLVERCGIEFALKRRLLLAGTGIFIREIEELFVDELRGELLEQRRLLTIGGVFELEGTVVGLGWSGKTGRGFLGTLQRLVLRHGGKAAEAMVSEQGRELTQGLGLWNARTRLDVVSGECGRDELGLH